MIRWLLMSAGLIASTLAWATPNIVVITVSEPLSASFMAQLGQHGVTLNRFAPAPVLSADRAALLMGRDPLRLGIAYSNIRPWDNAGIHPDEQLLIEGFKQAGYTTAFLGNWGLGHAQQQYHPLQRGFDLFSGQLLTDASPNFPYRAFGGIDLQKNAIALTTPLVDQAKSNREKKNESVNQWISDELTLLLSEANAREKLLSADASPLLAVLSLSNASHNNRNEVERLIRELVDASARPSDDTRTLFAILNRPEEAKQPLPTPNHYLTSAVLIGSQHLPAKTQLNQLVSPMDILPTLMALVDINWSPKKNLDGIDWSPLLLSSLIEPNPKLISRELTLVREAPHYGSFKLLQFDTSRASQTSTLGPILAQNIVQGFSSLSIQQQLCDGTHNEYSCNPMEKIEAKRIGEKLTELTRQRRALHPITGIRQGDQPPLGWRSPTHWQSITLSDSILQDAAAPGDVPEVARLPLDYQLGDKGRIIYDCEPKWWAFGLCF